MSAMPVMILVLCILAIAYRYYSAFLAARVAVLDDSKTTPAVQMHDGQNYHPTNKWVLFGHHFAAISGAGPLIGPVLAAQFGYLPGLLWIVIGVCLAGAVQDFLILAASIRRGGKSLAQIAFTDIGKTAGTAATIAILFIIVIALAGLGKVVVKALGGEASPLPAGVIEFPQAEKNLAPVNSDLLIPAGSTLIWNGGKSSTLFSESFRVRLPSAAVSDATPAREPGRLSIPAGTVRLMPGSPWGTFTIAATIPIALFLGVYMSRIRKGRILEASLIGGALTLFAVFLGGWIANSQYANWFNLSASGVTWSMAIYGFIAAVLPVWILLTPRDYLSSFLKIGTIAILVIGTLIANPKFQAPAINHVFLAGGPTVPGKIFPFLFITIMCGAISGFHALVSSGTTSKMLARESDARTIGYGAMLIEGLVGVVSIIAAASLPVQDYYAMNTDLAAVPKWHDRILQVGGGAGPEHLNVQDNLGQYESLTQESLRGRTGGAVTLAVGMAHIFDGLAQRIGSGAWLNSMWRYWYHFAIMFEALFILTTIDAGTRIGRFLLQEIAGHLHPSLGINGGWPSAVLSTAVIVLGWVYFLGVGPFATIWAMFGVANQMLAVIALAIAAVYLVNSGRGKFAWVAILPMAVVFTTTSTAAIEMLTGQIDGIRTQLSNTGLILSNTTLNNAALQAFLIIAMLLCTLIVLASATIKIWKVTDPKR